jgi:transaldolase
LKPTKTPQDLGQSLWLDNITRNLLNSGTLKRYIGGLSVTGLKAERESESRKDEPHK